MLLRDSVALRKESVDRNRPASHLSMCNTPVALRKESVDRNTLFALLRNLLHRRSPQGERG